MTPSSMPVVMPESLLLSYGLPGMIAWLMIREIAPAILRAIDRILNGKTAASAGGDSADSQKDGTPTWFTLDRMQVLQQGTNAVLNKMFAEMQADRQERQLDRQMLRETLDAVRGAVESNQRKEPR